MERRSQSLVYLDTHIVAWLYAGLLDKFTPNAKARIDDNDIAISQFVRLELQYLYEIGRIKVKPDKIIGNLAREIDLKISECPLNNIIEEALKINWTRDVFDRLLVAETMQDQSSLLITADKKIREKFTQVLW
ncbi:MAG: PIN domain-containing protein [Desulfobacterales bacterium]|jgi:PIN domain nuclease of toxin-antitoxin system